MNHSFILLKSPQICGDKKFIRHKVLMASYPGVFAEILDVVAFNCDNTKKIPTMVDEIFAEYRVKSFTEENHKVTTIMGACHAWLKENERLEIPDGVKEFLARYDVNIDDDNCLYVSMPDYVVTLANYAAQECLTKH
ncbi:MAG: hypothetical protein E7016_05285 [Alphaproteobacteria bacterium]|nr:hypothetical protein [Alphaproteobacteria bacterium]